MSEELSADEKLIERIRKSVENEHVSHAYIIEGDSISGKEQFAKSFLKKIVCLEKPGVGCDSCINCRKLEHGNYEDLYEVFAEWNTSKTSKSVRDEAIEELQSNLKMKPNTDRNLAIIYDSDTMTPRAQNRLLKTLEEPYPGTVIILLSENTENLIDTIKSRCIIYRLSSLDHIDDEMMDFAGKLIDMVIHEEKFFDIRNEIGKNIKDREDALVLLDSMERVYRDILLEKDDRYRLLRKGAAVKSVHLIEEARKDILFKVNYSYALKNLVLKL